MTACACGCGNPTTIARRHDARGGVRKGEPNRFLRGHHIKKVRPVGANNPNWKGGHHRRKDGYCYTVLDGRRVLDHRIIAEAALGKPLPETAIVHHADGDPSNNASIKLVLCHHPGHHNLIHRRTAALAACGNAGWRRCVRCHQHGDPAGMSRHNNKSMVHRECEVAYRRRLKERKAIHE